MRLMFTVLATDHGDPQELATRRDRFTCTAFAPALATDCRSGTITLQPDDRVLTVGFAADDYESVRIFLDDGRLVGAMRRSPTGFVAWAQPTQP
jgi:hypothetical protein